MSVLCLVFLSLFIFCCNGDQHSINMEECKASPESLINAINSTADYNLTVLIPNCLEYSDNSSSLTFGILSYQHNDGTTSGRYTVSCSNGILLLTSSNNIFRGNTSSCYQCNRDETVDDPCIQGTECPSLCQYCIQSQCVHCTYAAYNGSCLRTCPSGRQPNASNGNQCECPGNFTGPNCAECQIKQKYMYCDNGTLYDEISCSCDDCPAGYVQILLDPYSTVPQGVIGKPNDTRPVESSVSCNHDSEETFDDHIEGESSSNNNETERTICVQSCNQDGRTNWKTDHSGLCYACGITYCLECEHIHSDNCTLCRNGTLLRKKEKNGDEYICDGFYSAIRHEKEELEEEECEEREKRDREKLELEIILPILCFLTFVVFLGIGVFAHYRYPHVGHEKRHRDPKKKVRADTENTIEHKFHPQSTVRFR